DDVFGFIRSHRDRLVIIDEAYADLRQDLSMLGAAGMEPNLGVMRSFGKFFGLAGLRLGFVFATPAVLGLLADRLGPWAVSGPALAMADHAFGRKDLVSELRDKIDKAHGQTRSALNMAGVRILGETPLFFCCDVGNGGQVREALAEHQVLVRSFDHTPEMIRIGLVPDELSAVRLRETLRLVHPRPQ
ncbi:MAG: aminotransferase class I/II-fold pyridoxal phosphate-dependent enzyme, partial [Hoeflea sp.]